MNRIPAAAARHAGTGRHYAGEAMATARKLETAGSQAEKVAQVSALPFEPLWNRKGNVIHEAVDRLGKAQRAAAAELDTQESTAEAPRP